jgi:purine-binding chemotaxis protein CheW
MVCTFTVADLAFGLDASSVQEVVHGQDVIPVPLAPPAVEGMVNLRGEILAAVDGAARLGLVPAASAHRLHVVVRAGSAPVAVGVDAEGDVVEVADGAVEPVPPTLSPSVREVATGAYQAGGVLLLLLDPTRFVDLDGDGPVGAR